MSTRRVKWRAALLGVSLILLCPFMTAEGGQTQESLIFAGEDETYGYRYEAPGIGSISSSVKEGETAAVAVLAVNGGGRYLLYRDGDKEQYAGGDILYEEGDYELYLYPSETEKRFARFTFRIENDFENLGAEMSPGKTVENPELAVDYDKSRNLYQYTLPNGSGFWMSIPCGGITDQPVTMKFMTGSAIFMVFCDGEPVPVPEDMRFTKQGRYRMTVISSASMAGDRDANIYKADLSFIIGTGAMNQMDILNAPSGFLLDAVTCNGRSVRPDREEFIRLARDGIYRAVFVGREDRGMVWQLNFQRDTSPPCLKFDRPMDGGRLEGPVTYSATEPDCVVSIKFNGIEVPAKTRLIEGGFYEVTARDPAGNERIYTFYIESRYQLADKRIIIISAVVFVAAAIYFAYCRKSMQIL